MSAAVKSGTPHTRVELFDGHAASFRYWDDAIDWLAAMVPGGELDNGGRVFDGEGLHVGDVVDVVGDWSSRDG